MVLDIFMAVPLIFVAGCFVYVVIEHREVRYFLGILLAIFWLAFSLIYFFPEATP